VVPRRGTRGGGETRGDATPDVMETPVDKLANIANTSF
jgi:hypothetical protein